MERAVAPVVGVALLVGITVLTASAVATAALALEAPTEPMQASVSLSVDADTNRVSLTHRGGNTLDVRRLSVSVSVDGDSLAEQPPVPFFATSGYRSGPTGPFNTRADPTWRAGETAGFSLASTNAPTMEEGDLVTVQISREGSLVVRLRNRAS